MLISLVPNAEDAAVLLSHLAQLQLDRISFQGGSDPDRGHHDQRDATCPGCGVASARVHSRYVRRLVDSTDAGREALVALRVRRFFCDRPVCARKTSPSRSMA